MKRPSKKEIKALVDNLKAPKTAQSNQTGDQSGGNLSGKKDSRRIRKQGV